jgi:hypothetical protein
VESPVLSASVASVHLVFSGQSSELVLPAAPMAGLERRQTPCRCGHLQKSKVSAQVPFHLLHQAPYSVASSLACCRFVWSPFNKWAAGSCVLATWSAWVVLAHTHHGCVLDLCFLLTPRYGALVSVSFPSSCVCLWRRSLS